MLESRAREPARIGSHSARSITASRLRALQHGQAVAGLSERPGDCGKADSIGLDRRTSDTAVHPDAPDWPVGHNAEPRIELALYPLCSCSYPSVV